MKISNSKFKKIINIFFKKEIGVILLFIIITVLFFWKYFLLGLIPIPADVILGGYFPWLNEKWGYIVGVPVKNPLMSDIVSLQYPWRLTAINYLKIGELPLWDSTSFLGMSLIGNFQAGVFNPFNLLFFLPFSFNKIWGFQVVIQPLIAMVCMYLMLRNWKLNKLAAIFGAFSFAFSAQVLVWIEYNALGFSTAIFPLFVYILDKYLNSGKIIFLSGISFIVAYIIFVGYPQYLYYFTFFGFVYLIYLSLKKFDFKKTIVKIICFALFIFLGLGLSAITLLPGLESLSLSIKALDEAATQNSVLYFPWQNLITGFVPDYFGNPATNNYYGIGYYESLVFYTSIVALSLALLGVFGKKYSLKSQICLIFLALTFVFALPNPFSELLQNIGGIGFRGSVSSRVLFMYGFSISALAAIGIEKFKTEDIKKESWVIKLFPVLAVLGILFGIFIALIFVKYSIHDLNLIDKDYIKLMISVKNSILPLGLAVFVSAILITGPFLKNKTWLIIILSFVMLLDYYRFSAKYLPFIEEAKIFPTTPALNFLQNQETPFRIGIEKGELLPANTWTNYGLESVTGYNILLPRDNADYVSFLNSSEISKGYSRFLDISNFDSPLLDLANVKYLVVLLRKEAVANPDGELAYNVNPDKYKVVFKDGAVAVLENKDYIPRIYTIKNLINIKNHIEGLRRVNPKDFPRKESASVENIESKSNLGNCEITNPKYSAQKITLNTNCDAPGYLVFSQIFYPGWNALVNNKKTEIFKTNGIFSGISLPKGNSQIEIFYFPESFKIGMIISFLTLVCLTGFMLIKSRNIFSQRKN